MVAQEPPDILDVDIAQRRGRSSALTLVEAAYSSFRIRLSVAYV